MSEATINARLTIPNVITSLRLLLLPPFVACVVLQSMEEAAGWPKWAAFGLFLLMAVTDMFDGYLARRLGQISRLGAMLDAVADKTLLSVSMLLLFLVGVRDGPESGAHMLYLPGWVFGVAVGKDVFVTAGYWIVRSRTHDRSVSPGWMGKGCTTAQMALVLAMLLWFVRPDAIEPIARGLFYVATLLAIAASASYSQQGWRQWRAGPVDAKNPK
ncbi:MAG: CDP-alcohol phosphatidyltransferase family protein [Phycisphaerales bacterium]|nr:CDP-alcohol phosphatidyltransferase family protein [Phycisphaerales bacterium]MCB9856179.1 CDP-alcohol phosphatidyltransferase family protein [Phycisphaerales bacterium]